MFGQLFMLTEKFVSKFLQFVTMMESLCTPSNFKRKFTTSQKEKFLVR